MADGRIMELVLVNLMFLFPDHDIIPVCDDGRLTASIGSLERRFRGQEMRTDGVWSLNAVRSPF